MLFTLLYFINLFFQKISKERKILLFVIPIIVLYSVGITLMYFYYAKPSIIISTIIYKISLYISSNLLVTLWGPNKAISIEKYFPFPSPNFFKELSIQNLTELELTQREIEIYQLLKKGLKNSQIGENLFIDRRTVESHLFHIKIKLGFKTVTELRKHIKVTTPQKNFNKQSE
jgi:DNA-binding NarL/FixJ family response regulator